MNPSFQHTQRSKPSRGPGGMTINFEAPANINVNVFRKPGTYTIHQTPAPGASGSSYAWNQGPDQGFNVHIMRGQRQLPSQTPPPKYYSPGPVTPSDPRRPFSALSHVSGPTESSFMPLPKSNN